MEETIYLENPDGARKLLNRVGSQDRVHGKELYNSGKVEAIEQIVPGNLYKVRINDGKDFVVDLDGDLPERWNGTCSCEKGAECAHVVAACMALLAEHRTATVRGLSASLASAVGQQRGGRVPADEPLDRQLTVASGRPLARPEKRFLDQLHQLYLNSRSRQMVARWDLENLGLMLPNLPWGWLSIWPSFPKTEMEFWLYIANAVREGGGEVPEFMLPVSDVAPIEGRLQKWRRGKEIQRWEQLLSNLQLDAIKTEPTAQEMDLRLVLGESEMHLEIKQPESEEFQVLKTGAMRQLLHQHDLGESNFSLEGGLLWELFIGQEAYSISPRLNYDDPGAERILNRMLRVQALQSRICDAAGEPIRRMEQPLRWHLLEAAGPEEDYQLTLVRADGSPAPLITAVLHGNPSFYLAGTEMYVGPGPVGELLNPIGENRIPAPALERPTGLALLEALGLPLPERIQQRVRKIPYQIAITCELKEAWFGSEREDCYIQVLAQASDGHQQAWTGTSWLKSKGQGREESTKSQGKDKPIIVYDNAMLRRVPPLLAPLNLKPAAWGDSGLVMRVNKKFPEVFSDWVKSLPKEIELSLKGDLVSFLDSEVAGRVKLDVSEVEIDWFDLRVVLDVGDTTLTSEEIKLLLNAKGKFVRLKGKGWKRLRYDLSEDENDKLARLGLSARELSDEPQRLHALQLADQSAKKFLPVEQVEQIQRRADEIKGRVAPALPQGITAELRPYQLEGFHFLAYLATNRFGGILADDMGLGKTVQTLAWLMWLREQGSEQISPGAEKRGEPAPILVVCPKSVMDNWRAEAVRFAPSLRVRVWPAGELPQLQSELSSADLHVLNYSQLRNVGESLSSVRWLAVVLDEGQYIKNPSSQTAQVARALRAEHRLVLSGTPIENRLMDLWSLMAYAMPGVLGSRAQFGRLYDAKGDPFARRRLAARVRPFVLRRTKSQVARDLPDRIEEDLFCELEGEQKALYRAELKRAQQILLSINTQKELAQQQFHFLTSLLRLRQVCCHPRLVHAESKAEGAKTEALLEQLEPLMEEGQKVLVFSQFVELLNLLKPAIEQRNWPVFYLSGQTENRGELVQRFQTAEGPGVFLISLKAGGFGLNLTAASYVVLFDPWWNPAVENQAIDRTHRIGQLNKVIAYRLLIKNSVEEKIRELQKKKRALAEDVLGEEKFAQSLTIDDLRFLFSE